MKNIIDDKPKISVIMPFYNAEKFLDKAITSILGQTMESFEFIIINDASSDRSDEIVKKYLGDKRIVYIKNKKNMKASYNRNQGIKISKANLIAPMDGDDISNCMRLEMGYNFLKNNSDISVVGFCVKIINENGIGIGEIKFPSNAEKIQKTYFYHYPILQGTAIFRKQDLLDVGAYRTEYSLLDDIDLLLRLAMSGKRMANINEYLYKYRKYENSNDKSFKEKRNMLFKLRMELLSKYKPSGLYSKYLYTGVSFIMDSVINAKQKNILFNFVKRVVPFFNN